MMGLPPELEQCFPEMFILLKKVEVWWVVNVEIPTNPDLDGKEIDPKEVVPGTVAIFQMLLDVALGDEEQSRAHYRQMQDYLAAK